MREEKKRQSTDRQSRCRKKAERLPALLASEAGLTCRQFKPGTKTTCGERATGFLPAFGDTCDGCARGRLMVRHATERRVVVEKAA